MNNKFKLYYVASIVIGILFSINSILVPRIYGDTLNTAIYSKEASITNLILISIFQLVFVILSHWVNMNFKISATQYLRDNLVEISLKRDNAPSSPKKIESFLARFIPDIVELRYKSIINIFSTLSILIFSVIFLFKVHLYFAVIIFFFNILIISLPNFVEKYTISLKENEKEKFSEYMEMVSSYLEGFYVIKMFRYSRNAIRKYLNFSNAVKRTWTDAAKVNMILVNITAFIQILQNFLLIAAGIILISESQILAGDLLFAISLSEIIGAPIEILGMSIQDHISSKPLMEEYRTLTEDKESKGNLSLNEGADSIRINNLTCTVGNQLILNGINYEFVKGKKYLITGISGSGKSTLISIIARQNTLDYAGDIIVGGKNIQEFNLSSYYKKITYIPQKPVIFIDSIRENILMGREVDSTEYDSILRTMNIDYLDNRFKDSLNIEDLQNMSGGEKQRVSFARAMVENPDFILLDEVTSALDIENSRKIENLILQLKQGVIHISHKSELMERYDHVLELISGKLVEKNKY